MIIQGNQVILLLSSSYYKMNFIEYIPILTTIFSVFFFIKIWKHYSIRKTAYLLWWSIGVLTFGLGTLTESINILFGWSILNTKIWYIVGALLGGYPLAQGSVYLLMKKRFANITAIIIPVIIAIASIYVLASPIDLSINVNGKLSGKVFEWDWVRYFSPAINIFSFIFLVGGAMYSALFYFKQGKQARFKGNVIIAVGALLPGIGGSFTRAGYVNVLFVTEFIGLLLIYLGYMVIRNDKQLAQSSKPDIIPV